MKNFFKSRIFVCLIIIIFSSLVIFISSRFIKLDSSIQNLFPHDEKMEKSVGLTANSGYAEKMILFIDVKDEKNLEAAIKLVTDEVSKFKPELKNAIPQSEDINEIMEYSQKSSILLYPYEFLKNPFSGDEMALRLGNKEIYMQSNPFFSGSEGFFLDPLMMGFDVLKLASSISSGKYNPQFGGVVSKSKKSYMHIYETGFKVDNYDMSKKLFAMDKKITEIALKNNFTAFLYCAHFYYLDSYKSITFEVGLIFIISIILTFLVFFIFFNRLGLLFYSVIPIIGAYAVSFLLIAIFKKTYGGIAFAFGSTTAGIAIDYIVIYFSKINIYSSLPELRKKIGLSMFLGYLTTAIAFLILLFSDINSLKEIALFGFLSITVAFILCYFVLQNMIRPENYRFEMKKINFMISNKYLFIIWCCITFVFVIGIFFTRLEDNVMSLDKKHPLLDVKLKMIKDNFTESTDSIFICFPGKNRDEILDNSLEALKFIQMENPKLSFLTPAIFYPSRRILNERIDFIKNNFSKNAFSYYLERSNFQANTFDPWLENITNIESQNLPALPSYIKTEMNSMFAAYNGKEYLLIQIPDRKIVEQMSEILVKNKVNFFVVDSLADSARGLIKFENKALFLLYLSLFVIFLILLFVYKNPIHSFLAVLPSITGVISCFSISFFTGRGFNIMHLTSSILIVGIGVDYGIYVVGMIRDNHNMEEMRSTIQALFVCALCTIAGFGVLSISSNQAIFSLGTSMLAGIVMSFLTAYCAIPFLLKKK